MTTKQFQVFNPADGSCIGSILDAGPEDATHAIEKVTKSFPVWSGLALSERCARLMRWADFIERESDRLCALLSAEQGKPIPEAHSEITGCVATIKWCADHASESLKSETVASSRPNTIAMIDKKPIGPVVAITPWNFPASMVTRKIAPALAVGCSVILKPAEQTPLIAKALVDLAYQADIPMSVLVLLTSSASNVEAVGQVLCADDRIRKVSFTGSTEIGKLLMAQCAPTLKKLSLELGGNAPFIIFDDCDVQDAASGIIASKFRNAGQTCVSANRIYVQAGIYSALAVELQKQIGFLKVGAGNIEGVKIGPLIDSAAIEKVKSHITDSVARGAKILCGGKQHVLGGTFFEPTLLADMADDMLPACAETFGPVAALFSFFDEVEVIARANSTPYGLAAYVFTKDLMRAQRVCAGLDFGMVGVNEVSLAMPQIPFGGIKHSGFGREGGKWGFEEYVTLQYRLIGAS